MNKMSSTIKKIRDYSQLKCILPTYIATSFIKLEDKKLIQINMDSFIRLIHDDTSYTGKKDNILILQGGIIWYAKQSFYLKSVSSYFTKNIRVFLFEKYDPVIDMDYTNDLIDAMNYIKRNYEGRLATIGYSMGALLISAYLAKHKAEEADLFIMCCNTFDMNEFREVLNTNNLFKWIQSKDLGAFNTLSLEELQKKEKIDIESQNNFMNNLIEYLNETHKFWHEKTIYIVGKYDPITINYKETLKKFIKKPHTIVCKNGWHVCSSVVRTSFELIYQFFDISNHKGKNCKVKDLL
jgi:hypothetical protein